MPQTAINLMAKSSNCFIIPMDIAKTYL